MKKDELNSDAFDSRYSAVRISELGTEGNKNVSTANGMRMPNKIKGTK